MELFQQPEPDPERNESFQPDPGRMEYFQPDPVRESIQGNK